MSIEKTGVVMSRAAGMVLIIVGASSLLCWPFIHPWTTDTGGWTSYSPLGAVTNVTENISEKIYEISQASTLTMSVYIPSVIEVAAGFAMILLSRPIGRWLVKGIHDTDNTTSPDLHPPG